MKLFKCQACGNTVYFENASCVVCGHGLGFAPDAGVISTLVPEGGAFSALVNPSRAYRLCENAEACGCNWLVAAEDTNPLCLCCRHTRTVPNLAAPGNREAWTKIERAKRHLFYSLLQWRLPAPTRAEDPAGGLVFDLLADGAQKVLTGHDNGLITLNIAEADDAERESRRVAMGEPYRTLLGHMRHEIGHYYWDRLVRDEGRQEACRAVFGDERADYGEALQRHHGEGAPADWPNAFISAYATCHPFEDFAETWAHYMHIVDTLETASAFGLSVRPKLVTGEEARDELRIDVVFNPYRDGGVEDLVRAWAPVTLAMNSLNRSLGQPDVYPFVLSKPVVDKLGFIHGLTREVAQREAERRAA